MYPGGLEIGEEEKKEVITPYYGEDAEVKESSLIGTDSCSVTSSLTTDKDNINVGTFTFRATGLSNSNYKLPETNLICEYSINQIVAELIWDETTSWVYDGKAHMPTATIIPLFTAIFITSL